MTIDDDDIFVPTDIATTTAIECEVADFVRIPQPEPPPGKTGPKPKKMTTATYVGLPVGRPSVVVDPIAVYKLAALGLKNNEIANYLGIQHNALTGNFINELTKGREEMKITLRRAMLKNACVNNSSAVQIFLAKNMLGMSDSPINSDENTPLPWNSVE
jgi:hypothetical protein